MRKNKRKSLLKESVYQIFTLSFLFIVLVGIVVFYNGAQRYNEQKEQIQQELDKLSHIDKLETVQDEIKNIYSYLAYEYHYRFDYVVDLLDERTKIAEEIIKDSINSPKQLDIFINSFLAKYSYPVLYSIVDAKELNLENTKDVRYIHIKNDEYLKLSLNNDRYKQTKTEHILNNIDKFRLNNKGEFYKKILPEGQVTKDSCEFINHSSTSSYKCVDSLWGIEFGADYNLGAIHKELDAKQALIEKKIIQQVLATSILVILGVVAIIVFIKSKERIVKMNIDSINESLNSLDGDLTNLKLNLNSNIKYEEFKFLNLALNKFIIRSKKAQELIIDQNREILHKAYYDNVTGLKNTAKLLIDLKKYNHDDEDVTLVVMFIDLDKFKQINESKGRDIGDRILKKMADRFLSITDVGRDHVSRIAADEFVLAKEFDKNATKEEIKKFASLILSEINKPVRIGDDKFYLAASIGIAILTEEYDYNHEELLRSADSAMSVAKKKGSNKIEFYDRAIDEQRQEILNIQKNLRLALQNNEFVLFFQPKVSVNTGEIMGAEALIRWVRNDKIIPPGYFIGVAESSSLIVEIGKWVINESFRILRNWIDSGKPIKLSLNLSVKQLKSDTIIDDISTALRKYDIPPELIEFEITENFAIEDSENIERVNELKRLGVGLAIDDFGTGYSSLAYLHNLPFDVVKIDMSFVFNMSKDPKKQALVDAIVQMSKTLDKKTVAEGVEFREDLDLLNKFGCNEFQGYFFSKPLPEEEFYKLLGN